MLASLFAASRGYLLQPWNSPYWRWRIETYSGIPAKSVTRSLFFEFLWRERKALWKHMLWVRRMRRDD